jgi:hypothetical protein
VHADAPGAAGAPDVAALRREFKEDVGSAMEMDFEITDERWKPRTMIMVRLYRPSSLCCGLKHRKRYRRLATA